MYKNISIRYSICEQMLNKGKYNLLAETLTGFAKGVACIGPLTAAYALDYRDIAINYIAFGTLFSSCFAGYHLIKAVCHNIKQTKKEEDWHYVDEDKNNIKNDSSLVKSKLMLRKKARKCKKLIETIKTIKTYKCKYGERVLTDEVKEALIKDLQEFAVNDEFSFMILKEKNRFGTEEEYLGYSLNFNDQRNIDIIEKREGSEYKHTKQLGEMLYLYSYVYSVRKNMAAIEQKTKEKQEKEKTKEKVR